jgi:hypothetical protein
MMCDVEYLLASHRLLHLRCVSLGFSLRRHGERRCRDRQSNTRPGWIVAIDIDCAALDRSDHVMSVSGDKTERAGFSDMDRRAAVGRVHAIADCGGVQRRGVETQQQCADDKVPCEIVN